MAIEQLTVQGGILAVHPLCGAVAGAIGGGNGSHCKADAAAPDGGQNARQRIRRQQKKHTLGRLLHNLQQGVGRFLVHPLHMVEQHCAPLCRKAGVEDLAAHGRDLTDQIPPAAAHTGHGDGFPDDAGLNLAAVALTGLCHGTAALAPEQGFGGRAAVGVKVIRRHTAGRKPGSQPFFAHQQNTVGHAAAPQHQPDAGL